MQLGGQDIVREGVKDTLGLLCRLEPSPVEMGVRLDDPALVCVRRSRVEDGVEAGGSRWVPAGHGHPGRPRVLVMWS